MNLIDIQLIVHPNSKLTAIDDYSYFNSFPGELKENLDNYVSVELLQYIPDSSICNDNIIMIEYDHLRENLSYNSEFVLLKDGGWNYYKFMIPRLEYLFVEDGNGGYESVQLVDQLFVWNGKIYKYNDTDNIVLEPQDLYDDVVSAILEQSSQITYDSLLESTDIASEAYYCKKIVFSICNLTKCFVNLQRELMEKTFNFECVNISDLRKERDFLLCSIHVLDYLKDIKEFSEAQRILDNISDCTSCAQEFNCNCNG